jgi:hypothetical protein
MCGVLFHLRKADVHAVVLQNCTFWYVGVLFHLQKVDVHAVVL